MQWRKVFELQRFSAEKMQKVNLFDTERMFTDLYCFEP
ncbi:MAG: cupin domain-containing protein, partial [Deinococcus sp.]|nr:cupin domain-containing protein [Deinococcus sp.]